MANTKWANQTVVTEFILLGFGELHKLQILLSLLFLVIYIGTMAGNLLIVALVVANQHLHTPMYFLLGNLSCLETAYSSTILPRMLANFLTGNKTVSRSGCFTQSYFFGFLVATECYLLAVMSYDRYLAICKPLHYATFMNDRLCIQLAAGSWINGFIANSIVVTLLVQLTYCGPREIDHFFCEALPLIKLACSDTSLVELMTFLLAFMFTLPPFLLTLTSYIYIIVAILRISSTTGRQKVFSTCSSHLTVVSFFYGAMMIVYMLPKTEKMRELNKIFSLFYTVLPPMFNPLIYSLRNKEVKEALRKNVSKWGFKKSYDTDG
uniref:Olfactory receptor n=1 Tax=Sphenodon punctatus TaxID=8508 RepID=A0A8D0GP85_SPHPU